MSFISTLCNVATGAVAGVTLITALPVFGVVGTASVAGTVVGSFGGGAIALLDSISE